MIEPLKGVSMRVGVLSTSHPIGRNDRVLFVLRYDILGVVYLGAIGDIR